ncbi:MAG: EamA family transporter [Sporomusaceae bacterium]|nr:EamA family transporter [Sporomusaceae bacterium]
MMNYVWLLISVTLTVAASTLLKLGSRGINFEGGLTAIALGYLLSPLIIAGFVSYALAAVLWVYCLSRFDLSYVTFVSSIQYLLLLAVSLLIFQEQISVSRWIGCGLIMTGVVFWLRG